MAANSVVYLAARLAALTDTRTVEQKVAYLAERTATLSAGMKADMWVGLTDFL